MGSGIPLALLRVEGGGLWPLSWNGWELGMTDALGGCWYSYTETVLLLFLPSDTEELDLLSNAGYFFPSSAEDVSGLQKRTLAWTVGKSWTDGIRKGCCTFSMESADLGSSLG